MSRACPAACLLDSDSHARPERLFEEHRRRAGLAAIPARAVRQAVSHVGTVARVSRSAARWRVQPAFGYPGPARRAFSPRRGGSVRASWIPLRGLIGEQPAHRIGPFDVGERQAGEQGDGFGEVFARTEVFASTEVFARTVGVARTRRADRGCRRRLSRSAMLDFRPVGTSVGTSVRQSACKLLRLRAFRAMLSVL